MGCGFVIVSSTEPKHIRDRLSTWAATTLPETYGVDFLWSNSNGLFGAQRKEVADFVASVRDGRLAKELGQMAALTQAVVVMEGQWEWTDDGVWMGDYKGGGKHPWTIRQLRGFLWSVRARGIWVDWSGGWQETCDVVEGLKGWTGKVEHRGAHVMERGKPAGKWGTANNGEYAMWLMTGLPGVGAGKAKKIVERFGRVPLKWDCERGEMEAVEGFGVRSVGKFWQVFDNEGNGEGETKWEQ